ncbi:MAG TPA: histidinol-phosphate transaminase [Terriglobia bacterium]|nr:histidinol-phosphate transaminase [Terriglobia bacterium]
MLRPRKAIERLQDYHPPQEGRAEFVRLDFNENTVGCSPAVVQSLRRVISRGWLASYPEYQESRATLARHFGVAPAETIMTNGVDDAIKLICDTFVEPGEGLVIPSPTFAMYQFFQTVSGGEVRLVRYDEKMGLPPERVIAAINRKTRWVALANPNNPTGTLIPKSGIKKILEARPEALIFIDEAYFDFSNQTVLPWIRKYPNLLVGRTFSKAFGLAGLRTGFLFGNSRLIELLRRAHAVFAVNSMALAAGVEAIKHMRYVDRYAKMIVKNRESFSKALGRRGIAHLPSAANFILARMGARAPLIARRLRQAGILVRDWNHDPQLRKYLRITIGTKTQMSRLAVELKRLEHLIETQSGESPWQDLASGSPAEHFP